LRTWSEDRACGCLLGLAVGDAVGTTLEFRPRDTCPALTDMIGGGPFGLAPGEWTDDTSMALCLADSLIENGDLDETDLMRRFVRWWRKGENSVTGSCFDIGYTTRVALSEFERSGNPRAGREDPNTAGNGSLMRLAPAAIRHHANRTRAIDIAGRQSVTTHAARTAIDACAFFAGLLVDAINGADQQVLLSPRRFKGHREIVAIADGRYFGKERGEIESSGYVVHTLEAALWCVHHSADFREAVLLAANLGADADTVAAVTGQIAGAIWGERGIPADWIAKLAWRDEIRNRAKRLFALGGGSCPAVGITGGTMSCR
jgi:ADP-ribosyl-[dinitrogen reductase] hydrolase